MPPMTLTRSIPAAGFAATAIGFGPGRMGFGLFLPAFRESFGLSSGAAGLISGLGFLGFFAGLLAAYVLDLRHGPRRAVVAGLCAAAAGMALVATAPGVPWLAAGVFLAMSSAGFTWAPFNEAVQRALPDDSRPGALSEVSSGTALGVALAGAAALALALTDGSWRIAWGGFAAAAALAAWLNHRALHVVASPQPTRRPGPGDLLAVSALPLYGIALSFGATTAIYISFAADRVASTGGMAGLGAQAAPAVVFISYGVLGLAGLTTGLVKARTGLPWLLRLLLAVSAVSSLLVALWPGSWGAVVLSAGLQGVFVMMSSSVFAFWSERLFPETPVAGFTAALLALAAGSVAGPSAAGFAIDAFGSAATFLAVAAVSAATVALTLPGLVRERAAPA